MGHIDFKCDMMYVRFESIKLPVVYTGCYQCPYIIDLSGQSTIIVLTILFYLATVFHFHYSISYVEHDGC